MEASTPVALEARDLTKVFSADGTPVAALRGVSLAIGHGEMVSIMGPSGSGKSTLLHLLGALDQPTSGEVLLDGRSLATLGRRHLAALRGRRVGFVFQQFNLMPGLTAAENVALPALIAGVPGGIRRRKLASLLDLVGLTELAGRRPAQLSGGQQQRVAIARALIMDPAVVLADEPTGNLDSASGGEVMALLDDCHHRGHTVVIVTHDVRVATHAQRLLTMQDGQIVDETPLPASVAEADPLPGRRRASKRRRMASLVEMGEPAPGRAGVAD